MTSSAIKGLGQQHKAPMDHSREELSQTFAHLDEETKESEGGEPDGYKPMLLAVDSEDNDLTIDISVEPSTASTRSSLYESVVENGRTYHKYKQGNYYLPNDESEQSRLELNLAPIPNPRSVLDIGTGTGIWALEYAAKYPSASVIGVDLSPIQSGNVPPNCQFEVADFEDNWKWNQKFDFIHGRALMTCFQDPAAVFRKAYDALAPGGWFEMQDVHFKPHSLDRTVEGTALQNWNATLVEGAKKIGRDWNSVPRYGQYFKDVGFVDVVVREYAWPGNTWPKGKKAKTMGLWMLNNAQEGLSAISMAMMTRSLGMSAEEVELTLVDVRRDLKDKSIHAYYPVYVVYGRKPR